MSIGGTCRLKNFIVPRVDLAVPFAQRLVAHDSQGARVDVFYPASVRLLDMHGQIEDR